jgi:GTP-binding protein
MTEAEEQAEAERREAERIFRQPCAFVKGVVNVAGLPDASVPEVAFGGRSNVGKSSLLNMLIGQGQLARTSNTPGRTREINYFRLGDVMHIVDMPGYGYARAAKSLVDNWNRLIQDYLRGRTQLVRVFLLIDSRHGVKENDREIMMLMDKAAVSYQLVLTKIDKLKANDVPTVYDATIAIVKKHAAAFPDVLTTSAEKRLGIAELRQAVVRAIANY